MKNHLLKLVVRNQIEKKSCERVIREGQAHHRSVVMRSAQILGQTKFSIKGKRDQLFSLCYLRRVLSAMT